MPTKQPQTEAEILAAKAKDAERMARARFLQRDLKIPRLPPEAVPPLPEVEAAGGPPA